MQELTKRQKVGGHVPMCVESFAQALALERRMASRPMFEPRLVPLLLEFASNAVPLMQASEGWVGAADPHQCNVQWVVRPGVMEWGMYNMGFGPPDARNVCVGCGLRSSSTPDAYRVGGPPRTTHFECCPVCGVWICGNCVPRYVRPPGDVCCDDCVDVPVQHCHTCGLRMRAEQRLIWCSFCKHAFCGCHMFSHTCDDPPPPPSRCVVL